MHVTQMLRHVMHMSRMIQIRNVPDALHRRLRVRASQAGMTLSDYLKQELERSATQLTLDELRVRLSALPPLSVSEAPVDIIRAVRDRE